METEHIFAVSECYTSSAMDRSSDEYTYHYRILHRVYISFCSSPLVMANDQSIQQTVVGNLNDE